MGKNTYQLGAGANLGICKNTYFALEIAYYISLQTWMKYKLFFRGRLEWNTSILYNSSGNQLESLRRFKFDLVNMRKCYICFKHVFVLLLLLFIFKDGFAGNVKKRKKKEKKRIKICNLSFSVDFHKYLSLNLLVLIYKFETSTNYRNTCSVLISTHQVLHNL